MVKKFAFCIDNNSMKKALKLIGMYLIIVAVALLLGTLFYSLYLDILKFVAGKKMVFVDFKDFQKSFFIVAGYVIIFICPVLAYSRIRHKGGVLQLITYILLSVFSWGICFPFVVDYAQKNSYYQEAENSKYIVTANYFRDVNGTVYYLTNDLDSTSETLKSSNAVVIDTTKDDSVEIRKIANSNNLDLYKKASPFSDILTKQTFTRDSVLSFVNLNSIFYSGYFANKKGMSFWLGFLSFAFVLCAIYGLSNINDWKLINSSVVIITSILTVLVNTLYFSPVFTSIKSKSFFTNKLFVNMRQFVDEPFLVVLNCFFGLLFIFIGIITYFKKRNSAE